MNGRSMSIRRSLVFAFVLAVTSVLLVVGSLVAVVLQASESLELVMVQYGDTMLHAKLARYVQGFAQESAELLAGGEGDELAMHAKQVDEIFDELDRKKDEIVVLEGEEEAMRERANIAILRRDFDTFAQRIDALAKAGRSSPDFQERLEAVFDEVMDGKLLKGIEAAMVAETQELARHVNEYHQKATTLAFVSGSVAAVVTIAFGVFLAMLFSRLHGGLQRIADAAERIAGGDYHARVDTTGPEEVYRISEAFNSMAQRVQESHAAQEKLATIGALAASVGHELRNPLGAIKNATLYLSRRIAKTELASDARINEFTALIDKELAASAKIVADLLDFARERQLTLAPCPLRPLVADAISIIEVPAHVTVDNDVPDSLPVLDLDRDMIRQVVTNLVQNALEAAGTSSEGKVRIEGRVQDDSLLLSVIDNGPGISETNLQRIFEPLFTTKLKGTGLGLAIGAGIVKKHGGRIDVQTKENAGTTFTIRLPYQQHAPNPGAV